VTLVPVFGTGESLQAPFAPELQQPMAASGLPSLAIIYLSAFKQVTQMWKLVLLKLLRAFLPTRICPPSRQLPSYFSMRKPVTVPGQSVKDQDPPGSSAAVRAAPPAMHNRGDRPARSTAAECRSLDDASASCVITPPSLCRCTAAGWDGRAKGPRGPSEVIFIISNANKYYGYL